MTLRILGKVSHLKGDSLKFETDRNIGVQAPMLQSLLTYHLLRDFYISWRSRLLLFSLKHKHQCSHWGST